MRFLSPPCRLHRSTTRAFFRRRVCCAGPSVRGVSHRRRHFINLTNGLEVADILGKRIGVENVRFTRIQSSHCEAGAFDKILNGVGPELLFSLALGYECIVYDFGSRDADRGVPRSIFMGVEFLKWALKYLWFDLAEDTAYVRGVNVAPYWNDSVMRFKVEKKTKKMIRYYKAFAAGNRTCGNEEDNNINLFGVYGQVSSMDGRKNEYVDISRQVWKFTTSHYEHEDDEFDRWLEENGLYPFDSNSSYEELCEKQKQISER